MSKVEYLVVAEVHLGVLASSEEEAEEIARNTSLLEWTSFEITHIESLEERRNRG